MDRLHNHWGICNREASDAIRKFENGDYRNASKAFYEAYLHCQELMKIMGYKDEKKKSDMAKEKKLAGD